MAQQGFVYEENTVRFLKAYGLSDGVTAGASHDKPDVMLVVNGKKEGCELKISPTAGGSLVIKAYANSTPHWKFGKVDHDETEKVFLMDLAKSAGVLDEINKRWSSPVFLVEDRDRAWEQKMLTVPLRDRYSMDLKTCPDIKMELRSNAMSQYYNTKNTYYINVGTHGFYLLGSKDPLKLNDMLKAKKLPLIPLFENACRITARVRCQSKGVTKAEAQEKSKGTIGGQGYQFTFTLEFAVSKGSSPYNIAPCTGDNNVNIVKDRATLTCLGYTGKI